VPLYCATTNAGKLREYRLAAGELAGGLYTIAPLPDLHRVAPAEEDGASFEANAAAKAVYYSGYTSELVFADDSGLAVDALGGAPGVHSAHFAGPGATDEKNNRLLLERLDGVNDRRARFTCVIALARQGRLLAVFRGAVEGEILRAGRGASGFGYDPLFYCPLVAKTFGEASGAQKLAVSHRGEAVRKMLAYLRR